MTKKDSFLILSESRNAMDFLIQSLVFLSQVEQNNYYLKWFVIAFHGAVHSFMLLVLQKVNANLIYSKPPKKYKIQGDDYDPFDGQLRNFLNTYSILKNKERIGANVFLATDLHDEAMIELNNNLRNQFIHFKPMAWGAEPWYPARVCHPLLDVLRFCIKSESIELDQSQKEIATAYVDSLDRLLIKHKE